MRGVTVPVSKVQSQTWLGLQWSWRQSQCPELPPTVRGVRRPWATWGREPRSAPCNESPGEPRGTGTPSTRATMSQIPVSTQWPRPAWPMASAPGVTDSKHLRCPPTSQGTCPSAPPGLVPAETCGEWTELPEGCEAAASWLRCPNDRPATCGLPAAAFPSRITRLRTRVCSHLTH